jgi:hypothetical protein
VGRRVNTLCQGEDGVQHQLVVLQTYHNFVLPHASLRQPLRVPEPTNGRGSAKQWRPCTPAMAAGFTNHVWSLKGILLYHVPHLWRPGKGPDTDVQRRLRWLTHSPRRPRGRSPAEAPHGDAVWHRAPRLWSARGAVCPRRGRPPAGSLQ